MYKLVALLGLIALILPTTVMAASTGTALGVNPDARLEGKVETKTLVVGTDVFIGDSVVTDARGLVQIRFSDRTELVVGPGSALVIEDYLLREDGSGGKFAINALAGTFRFVTGGAPKDRYAIRTPTGTVGVRGTAFDLNVKPDHSSLLLYHGAVVMCNTGETASPSRISATSACSTPRKRDCWAILRNWSVPNALPCETCSHGRCRRETCAATSASSAHATVSIALSSAIRRRR